MDNKDKKEFNRMVQMTNAMILASIGLSVFFVWTILSSAQAAYLPTNPELRNFSQPTKQACEARAKGSCFYCPSEHRSTGCIDFRLTTVEVDNTDKPIIECEKIEIWEDEPLEDSCNESEHCEVVEHCETVSYEKMEVEKVLLDENLRNERLQAEQEAREVEQRKAHIANNRKMGEEVINHVLYLNDEREATDLEKVQFLSLPDVQQTKQLLSIGRLQMALSVVQSAEVDGTLITQDLKDEIINYLGDKIGSAE